MSEPPVSEAQAEAPPRRVIRIDGYWLFIGVLLGVHLAVLTPFFPSLQPIVFAPFLYMWMLHLKRLDLSRARLILPGILIFTLAGVHGIVMEERVRLGPVPVSILCWIASTAAYVIFSWRIGRLKPAIDPSVFSEESEQP